MFLISNADTIVNDDFLNKFCEKYDKMFHSNIIEISKYHFAGSARVHEFLFL